MLALVVSRPPAVRRSWEMPSQARMSRPNAVKAAPSTASEEGSRKVSVGTPLAMICVGPKYTGMPGLGRPNSGPDNQLAALNQAVSVPPVGDSPCQMLTLTVVELPAAGAAVKRAAMQAEVRTLRRRARRGRLEGAGMANSGKADQDRAAATSGDRAGCMLPGKPRPMGLPRDPPP